MLLRAIALSLALLFGIGVIIPLSTDNTEAGPRKQRKQRKHYKKYSKKWWRQYRARQARRKSMQARTRALRLRQIRLAKIRRNANTENAVATAPKRSDKTGSVQPKQANSPAMMNVAQSPNGDVRFRVDDSAGSQVGSASISVVGPAVGETTIDGRNKAVGGVSTTTLRREIINRKIQENGGE